MVANRCKARKLQDEGETLGTPWPEFRLTFVVRDSALAQNLPLPSVSLACSVLEIE